MIYQGTQENLTDDLYKMLVNEFGHRGDYANCKIEKDDYNNVCMKVASFQEFQIARDLYKICDSLSCVFDNVMSSWNTYGDEVAGHTFVVSATLSKYLH